MNLDKEMATNSSILACEIQWTEEADSLWPVELDKSQT